MDEMRFSPEYNSWGLDGLRTVRVTDLEAKLVAMAQSLADARHLLLRAESLMDTYIDEDDYATEDMAELLMEIGVFLRPGTAGDK